MRRCCPACRVLVLVAAVWLLGLTSGRGWLHNHSGLAEREDCPACRVEKTAGVAASAPPALPSMPTMRPAGIVPDAALGPALVVGFALEPPPRSPPCSA